MAASEATQRAVNGDMRAPRWYPTAITLANGEILALEWVPLAKAAKAKKVTDKVVPAAQKAAPQVPIPTDPATLRTLTNSNGSTALAVFSDEAQLQEASMRYGWLGIDGRVVGEAAKTARGARAADRRDEAGHARGARRSRHRA